MSANNTVQELNRQLAGRINAEARSNPQSPYANKFIGLGTLPFCLANLAAFFEDLLHQIVSGKRPPRAAPIPGV